MNRKQRFSGPLDNLLHVSLCSVPRQVREQLLVWSLRCLVKLQYAITATPVNLTAGAERVYCSPRVDQGNGDVPCVSDTEIPKIAGISPVKDEASMQKRLLSSPF